MARDDPKKPVKNPRKDIRNDKRPIPQEHHSARGDAPRNSGNFTRGSQLLNTQVLMWLQGIKMPVYMWLGVFVIAYSTILTLTLDENNIQLISMRILSGLWDWISFDEMKRINLRLPDNSVRHTYMGYVPYVPEVILAWHKAVKGLLGSVVAASCITVPLSIWYVDFSARRGKAMIQERHERGAMLVDRDLLYSEIAAHNKVEFVKEAARLFPGDTPEQVLKLKFKARKMGGIHHPYSVAGIPFPYRLEQSHFLTLGTTGSGKTTVFRKLLAQMTAEKKPGSILFITSNYTDLEMNRALLTLWSNLAIHSLMTMRKTRDLRTWFVFDELGALGSMFPGGLGFKQKVKASQTMLTLVEVKTGIQQAVATGSARKKDLSILGGGILTNAGIGALGGNYTSTDMGKITSLAMLDAFRKLTTQAQTRLTAVAATPAPAPMPAPAVPAATVVVPARH